MDHLHHRANVDEKILELVVKKIANNNKIQWDKDPEIGGNQKGLQMTSKLLTKLPLLYGAKTNMQDIALVVYFWGNSTNFFLEVWTTRSTISDLVNLSRDAYAAVLNANSLVKLTPQELIAAAQYELKLRGYKANDNYVNTQGQDRNQKYFSVIVSRYPAPASMEMDLDFLGADAISDADEENIDISNVNASKKVITSILAMSALEAHNAQVAVVATRNGATPNLTKDPTIGLSLLRGYTGTAPNIALPGGERNNRLDKSAVASTKRDDGSLVGPPAAHPSSTVATTSLVRPTTTFRPLNAGSPIVLTVPTVPTLQSLSPFDPAPGWAMKKPSPKYPAKKKSVTHKTPKYVSLKIVNSVSAAMHGTQVSMSSAPLQADPLPSHTALVRRAKNAAISRAGTPVLNVDTDLPSSPDSALGKDVAHFFVSLHMAPLRGMVRYVLETKKNANPENLKHAIHPVYPFFYYQKKMAKLELKADQEINPMVVVDCFSKVEFGSESESKTPSESESKISTSDSMEEFGLFKGRGLIADQLIILNLVTLKNTKDIPTMAISPFKLIQVQINPLPSIEIDPSPNQSFHPNRFNHSEAPSPPLPSPPSKSNQVTPPTKLIKIPYVGDLIYSIAQRHLNGVEDILNWAFDRIVWSSEDKSVSSIDNGIQSEGVVVSKQVIHDETFPVSIDSWWQILQDTLNECSKGNHVSPCCIELDPSLSLLIAGYRRLQGMIDTMAIVPPLSDPSTDRILPHLLVGVLKLDSGLI
eukprot:jgi/Psemu1/40680/gm1.40680_g